MVDISLNIQLDFLVCLHALYASSLQNDFVSSITIPFCPFFLKKPRILAQVQEHFFHKIFCQFFRPICLKQSRRSPAPAQWHVTSNARAPSQ